MLFASMHLSILCVVLLQLQITFWTMGRVRSVENVSSVKMIKKGLKYQGHMKMDFM